MINEKIVKALSDQINAEFYSAYLYLAMSAYAEDETFKGAAHWLFVQAQEEMTHAIHMYKYLLDRDEIPTLPQIDAPEVDFKGFEDIFIKTLEHEKTVTARLNNIAKLAMEENDHALYQFIMWYVNEQVEEEANAKDILGKYKIIGKDNSSLITLDNELGARMFVHPFPMDLA